MSERSVLIQEQGLEQRLTPLQVQYVRMLEMTGPEVEDAVRRTVDENPALDVDSGEEPHDAGPDDEEDYEETAEELRMADYGDPDEIPSYRLEARNGSIDDAVYRSEVSDAGESLIDTLTEQVRHLTDDARAQAIAEYIIGNVDDNGYLQRSPRDIADDIAMYGDLPDVTTAEVERVLDMVQSLDPAGVAAVDLRECLLLQLDRLDRTRQEVSDAVMIVADFFDRFTKRHFDAICSAMHIDRSRLGRALEVIGHLNPKPGAGFARTASDDLGRTVTPDFNVECDDNGHLTVTLLNRVPHLVISQTFTDVDCNTRHGVRADAAATFIRRRRDEASNFIKAIEMRNNTMFRVMSAIVRLQRQFFVSGDTADIRPMLLRDVAAVTGDDMSTVSRATSNKYVQTEAGIFPLKTFFNERASTTGSDDDLSTRAVLDKLKALIEAEDKHRPLSDEALTKALADAGFNIARRTVTKYRERLRLPVARLRREL